MSYPVPPTCRVPVFSGNKEIQFVEKPVPEPGPGQLLLRVRANALCGSERPQVFACRLRLAERLGGLPINVAQTTLGEYFRYNELPANLQRLRQHRDYLGQNITHRLGGDRIQEAFQMFFLGGETGKVIIEQ
jgi:hypothetical protein